MKTSNKITIILGVGGVIAVGFYFLRKSKPTVQKEQLAKLNTDTVSSIEEELATKPSVDEQLLMDKCAGLGRNEYQICKNGGVAPVKGTSGTTSQGTRGNTSNTNSTNTSTASTTNTRNTTNISSSTRGSSTGGRLR